MAEQIREQVEFYFSESNLLNDKFLFTTQNANDGWVPIQTISQFERMKKFRPIESIVDALRESTVLDVSENGELVRRSTPLSKNYNEIQLNINKRSVFVNKLPQSATLDELLTFFRNIAPVNQVRMRKGKDKSFSGSCLVEFKDENDATKLLESDLQYNDEKVEVVSKAKFEEAKAQKFGARRGRGSSKVQKSTESTVESTESVEEAKKRDASPTRSNDQPEKVRD